MCFGQVVYNLLDLQAKRIDKYRVELSRKKPAVLWYFPYCRSTLLVLYNLLCPGTSFYRKNVLKNYLIFSKLTCHAFPSSFHYKLYFTFTSSFQQKNCNGDMSMDHTVLLWCTTYNLWTLTRVVHFELLLRLKETEQNHTEG